MAEKKEINLIKVCRKNICRFVCAASLRRMAVCCNKLVVTDCRSNSELLKILIQENKMKKRLEKLSKVDAIQKLTSIAKTSSIDHGTGKFKVKTRVKKSERNAKIKKTALKTVSVQSKKISIDGSMIPKFMHVIGITQEGGGAGRKVIVRITSNGRDRVFTLPVTELAIGETISLAIALANTGHYEYCDRPRLKRLAAEILQLGAKKKVIVLSTNGHHEIEVDGETYSAYVWGSKAYWLGEKPPTKIIVANSQTSVQASCTNDEWKNSVGKYLQGNPYLTVVHAHALSAAIRRSFNKPRTSICLVGPSGTGKTTTQQCGQSQIGSIDKVISMSGTKIGIIEHLLDRPDSPVFFQDIRQNDNIDNFIDLVFDTADGAGRLKSGEEQKKIAATMLLSNERLVVDMVSRKVPIDEGVYARLFELVCCAPHGAFHDLHDCDTAANFADTIKENSAKYYGAVWPAWLQVLSKNWPKVLELYKAWLPKVKAAIAKRAGEAAHGRVNNRILDAMSFSAWAGLIAVNFNILPIKRIEIIDAFGLVMREYIDRQAAGSTPLTDQLVSAVRGCLDEGSGRFPRLKTFNDGQHSTVYGFRRKSRRHGELYLFLPHIFDRLFNGKFGSFSYEILEEAGFLVKTDGRGNQYQVRIPVTGEQKSFIAIKASIRFD